MRRSRSAVQQASGGSRAPLARMLDFARPAAGRLVLATLLGACALAAAIGLIATSAWLISRSSQRPQESAVAVAIVGVQFFALARGLCRYAERLVGHDAAFRVLRDLRVSVYERLERLAPLGLPAFRSGDLLARLVHDVDSLQDLLLRVVPAFVIAAIVGLGTVALVWWMLPGAGLILLVTLALAGTVVPWLTAVLAARAETRQALARSRLTAAVVDLVEGAPELAVNGATAAQLSDALAADAELTQIAAASARTAGVGQGLTSACIGLAMWGSLLVGVAAVRAGRMDGVLLAGLALIPLVAFELVSGLPGATQTLQRVRRSAARVQEVMDAEPLVQRARASPQAGVGPVSAARARARLQLSGPGTTRARRRRPRPRPGPPRGGGRRERCRQVDAGGCAASLPALSGRLGDARRCRDRTARQRLLPARDRAGGPGRAYLRQHARREPAPGAARGATTTSCSRRWPRCGCWTGCRDCRRASTPR